MQGMSDSTLVRTDLTPTEWKRIRKLAIDRDVRISVLAGDALRALLKGGKP